MNKLLQFSMLKKLTISLITILLVSSPIFSKITFDFDVLDRTLKLGETVKIGITCNRKILKPTAWFAGRSWKINYVEKIGHTYHYVLYAGLSRYLEPKVYNCVLTLPLKNSSFKKTFSFDIRDGKFPYGTVALPKVKKSLANNTKQLSKESQLITSKFGSTSKHRQNKKLTSPFILPAKGNFSSEFGKHRKYKGTKKSSSKHSGLDIANVEGTEIVASHDGIVIMSESLKSHGLSIMIDHGFGIKTIYNHMSKLKVKHGDIVTQGQLIGKMGTTGISTGSHLHWGLGVQNVRVNPLYWVNTRSLYTD
ncbi:M23 family metallopeptidase [bacterium]|jgi:hypothetical protein|nr:M23 family metallopeptidase [bacterium]